MKKNNEGFIQIIIILLALVLVVAGAYYFGTKNKSAPTPSPVASTQPSSSPTATADPTANWKTYTSTAYSFKYPTDWNLTEGTDGNGKKTGDIFVLSPTPSEKVGAYPFDLFIIDTKLLTVSSYVQSLIAQPPVGEEAVSSSTQTQITVGGQPAIELTGVFAGDSSEDWVYTLFNGKIYQITFKVGQDNSNYANAVTNYAVANQILSTFKFTK
jgi:hypothetical protein